MSTSYTTPGPATLKDIEAMGWREDEQSIKDRERRGPDEAEYVYVSPDGRGAIVVYPPFTDDAGVPHLNIDVFMGGRSLATDDLLDGLGAVSEHEDEFWQTPWNKELQEDLDEEDESDED